MGLAFSVFGLYIGTIATAIVASIATHKSIKKDWPSASAYTIINAVVAALLVAAVMGLMIVSMTRGGIAGSLIADMAFGVDISFILMLGAMIGTCVLSVMAALAIKKKDENHAAWYNVGVAIMQFGMTLLVPLIVILLL